MPLTAPSGPINMGLGKLGGGSITHKRKFRWTFEVQREGKTVVSPAFVKTSARPNITIEETEINFLNGKTFIPGKGTWETITVTYYDVASPDIDTSGLYSWLADVYNFLNPVRLTQNSKRSCYTGTGKLFMYDGCGNAMEGWELIDCWPQAVNFGELDYQASEEQTVEVTLRYANVQYETYCGLGKPKSICCSCKAGDGAEAGDDVSSGSATVVGG